MTIAEAATKWDVTKATVYDYIDKGYIYGLYVENNIIMFPEIPKPYVKKKPKTVNDQDKYILTTMNKDMYVNAKIMDMSEEKFKERIIALIKSNKIYIKKDADPSYASNLDFGLLSSAGNIFSFSLNPALTLDCSPSVEIKVADQIGLINGKIG